MKNKAIVATITLSAVFLVGFVPQYVKANRLENELRQSRQEAVRAELRDLVGFAYVQASQKNYGLAAETNSRFFNRVREVANQTQGANRRTAREALPAARQSRTAAVPQGDRAVRVRREVWAGR